MKCFAIVLAVLILMTDGHGQVHTFPYFYDWTGAVSITGDGNFSSQGTVPFTTNGAYATFTPFTQTTDNACLRVAVDATGRTFTSGETYSFSIKTFGNATYSNGANLLVETTNNTVLLPVTRINIGTDRVIEVSLPASLGNTQFNIDIIVTKPSEVTITSTVQLGNHSLLGGALPITLSSITLHAKGNNAVELKWTTVSEINNYGFEVQRSSDGKTFTSVVGSFVPGNGTTNLPQAYSYVDANPAGSTSYRLKQIDLDGTVNYTESVQLTTTTDVKEQKPSVFALARNYPNPFNPSTTIRYGLPNKTAVQLSVFNTLGQSVSTLVNGEQEAGYHEVKFDGSGLSSGIYFYRLQAGSFVETRKLVLVR
jgi:hypothetical protein